MLADVEATDESQLHTIQDIEALQQHGINAADITKLKGFYICNLIFSK